MTKNQRALGCVGSCSARAGRNAAATAHRDATHTAGTRVPPSGPRARTRASTSSTSLASGALRAATARALRALRDSRRRHRAGRTEAVAPRAEAADRAPDARPTKHSPVRAAAKRVAAAAREHNPRATPRARNASPRRGGCARVDADRCGAHVGPARGVCAHLVCGPEGGRAHWERPWRTGFVLSLAFDVMIRAYLALVCFAFLSSFWGCCSSHACRSERMANGFPQGLLGCVVERAGDGWGWVGMGGDWGKRRFPEIF